MLPTVDDLYLLESIARDATKSNDERAEARRRLRAGIALLDGMMTAQLEGSTAVVSRQLREMTAALEDMGRVLQEQQRLMMSAENLTALQAALVRARVERGEPFLDALCAVLDQTEPMARVPTDGANEAASGA